MESGQSPSWCSIVPEIILQGLANQKKNPELRDAARNTIEIGRMLFETRGMSSTIISNANTFPESFGGKPPNAYGIKSFVYDANGGNELPGTLVPKNAKESLEFYHNLKKVWHFFKECFNWKLFDNKGNSLHVTLNFGKECINAYWNGSQVILGSGSTKASVTPVSFNNAIDVFVHELTHGIISQTSGLHYKHESGALNEHLADVFAILYSQCNPYNGDGGGTWLIGHHVYILTDIETFELGVFPQFLRSFKDPKLTDPNNPIEYPAPPRKLPNLPYDNGGVHRYASIPNLAFYIAVKNAADAGSKIPWEGIGQIWFAAMTDPRLRPDSKFSDFAALTICWAKTHMPHLTDAIIKGWKEVKVKPCTEPPPSIESLRREKEFALHIEKIKHSINVREKGSIFYDSTPGGVIQEDDSGLALLGWEGE
ncbi:MAG: Translation initiation factor 3 subunit b [Trizodia sp. TS-e1964]|nr:MAG: Translation initiation factor 3 subunit b [Trizodia sp. TS-e1964]